MKNSFDYKSRFRILKGGKISLVVSAMVLNTLVMSPLNAAISIKSLVSLDDSNATFTLQNPLTYCGETITNVVGIGFSSQIANHNIVIGKDVYVNLHNDADSGNIGVLYSAYGVTNTTITNKGILNSSSSDGNAVGIFLENDVNTSVLNNENKINITANDWAVAMFGKNLNSSSIQNSGEINVLSSTGEEVRGIDTVNMNGSTISNSGDITLKYVNSGSYNSDEDYNLSAVVVEKNATASSIINNGNISVATFERLTLVSGIKIGGNISGSSVLNTGNINLNGYNVLGFFFNGDVENTVVENRQTINILSSDSGIGVESDGNFFNSKFINSAKIIINGENAIGMYATEINSSVISNTGTVILNSRSRSATSGGIVVDDLNNRSIILNTGDINLSANETGSGYSYGLESDWISGGSKIINDGKITVVNHKSVSGTTAGIMVDNFKPLPASYDNIYYLINRGTISIGVDTNASLVLGIGSAQDLEQNSYISNSGSMVINADDNASLIAGISVNGGMDDDSYISNSGSIEFNANNNTNVASGIYIEKSMSGSSFIRNRGTITGNIVSGAKIDGIGVYSLTENSSVVNDGNIILTETNSSDSDNYFDGIDIGRMEDNASVYNNGLISLNLTQNSVSGEATGIFIFENRYNYATQLVNNGKIEISAESKDEDSYFYLSGLYKENTIGYDKIINKGLISINSKAADMDIEGIYAGDVTGIATVENKGYIMISTDYIIPASAAANILTIEPEDNLGKNIGISIYHLENNAGIINSGGIYFSTSQESIGGTMTGIEILSAIEESFILNSGDIVMNTKTDLNDSQLRLGGILIERGLDDNSVLTNSGNIIINAKADYTDIKGISIERGMKSNASVGNGGLVSINVNSLSSDNVIGINTNDLRDDTKVENSGKISVDVNSDGANIIAGIYVDDMSDNAQVVNTGSININTHSTKSKAINGIYIDSMKSNNSIINSGSITVDSGVGLYAAGVYVNGAEEGAYFENRGSIISSAYSVFVDRDSNFSLNNTGYMSGLIYAPLTEIDNGKNGEVSLSSPGESEVKDFYNEEGAVLEFNVNTEDNGSVKYAKLNASDKVVVSNNSTLGFKVDSGFYSSTTDGEVLNEIVKTPEMDINTSKVNVTDNSLLLDFEIEKGVSSDGNETLNAKVVKHTLKDVMQTINTNTNSVAKVLDTKFATATGELKRYLDNLVTISSSSGMNNAVREAQPVTAANVSRVSVAAVNSMCNVIQSRQTAARGLNSGDTVFSNKHIWFKPFGSHTTQDDIDGKNGYSANTYGFGIGIDGEYDEAKTAGISFFYARLKSDTNDIDQESTGNIFSLIAYGNKPVMDNKTTIYYQLGFTRQNIESRRNITTAAVTATANYHTNSILANMAVEKIYEFKNRWNIKPKFRLSYQYAYTPGYSESGAGNLDLNVNSYHAKSFIAGIGSTFSYLTENNIRFMMNFALDYDFNAKGQSIDSSFQDGEGAVFTTQGIDKDPLIYNVGMGMHENLNKNLTFELKYDYKGRSSGFANHSLYGLFNYKF